MKFFQDLYLGEKISSKKDEILKKLNSDKPVLDLYLIIISEHPDNTLEIIPQREILQKNYPNIEFRVVGIAKGKKEAFVVVQNIIEEAFRETGIANARDYLNQRWEEQA